MYFLVTAIGAVMSSYVLLILILKRGWRRARRQEAPDIRENLFISVIIPVRNEASSIGTLLQQVHAIQYPHFEVIVVDDHSRDRTFDIVQAAQADKRVRLVRNNGQGKKNAVTTGVRHAQGSIIVTTDGDCKIESGWLSHFNAYFQKPDTMMVFGGVSIQSDTFFADLQAIEFSSLIGSGISLWALRNPVMCNGANLGFRKQVFREVDGYAGNDHIASGDDEFLMRKILAKYPGGIAFLNTNEGNVMTKPAPDLSAFIQQRLRWAGKWKYNQSRFSKFLAVYVLIVQLAMIASFTLLVLSTDPGVRIFIGTFLGLKLVAECMLLIPVCVFLGARWRWDAFIILQFIYPFYVVGIGLFSNLTAVKWKDRNI